MGYIVEILVEMGKYICAKLPEEKILLSNI
ncbi:hypothetical protein KKB3_00661 [Dehalococcoides mccartyi]|jgi:hypothetical protein|nr:hypothetical protein KKB3_00661 [Dehalococcoides mccartyi]